MEPGPAHSAPARSRSRRFVGAAPCRAGHAVRPAVEVARGLLLLHGTSDIAETASVDELPVQLHVAEPDPFEPDDWLSAWYLRIRAIGADVEVYRYRGAGHFYTDPGLPDYDAEAAEATWKAALGFLETL